MLKHPRMQWKRQAGMGITELMIGSLVGLIIIGGLITVYSSTVKGSADTLKAAKLNQELSAAMSLMVSDLRRAGYWGAAMPDDLNNPFMKTTSGTETNLDIRDSGNCILFTYDLNSNGGSTGEFFGYKLDNGVLKMREPATATTTADCSAGTWTAITDPRLITVTQLSFESTGSKCLNTSSASTPQDNWAIDATYIASNPSDTDQFPCRDDKGTGYVAPATGDVLVETRQVTITLAGTLVTDTSVNKDVSESVRVRNDRILKK